MPLWAVVQFVVHPKPAIPVSARTSHCPNIWFSVQHGTTSRPLDFNITTVSATADRFSGKLSDEERDNTEYNLTTDMRAARADRLSARALRPSWLGYIRS